MRYAKFMVPLVKAVQELAKENEELKARLKKLENK
jgi:cell shape-determining protein MreC